ncbi:uncharacterized protein LOC131659930 [Vicia villosa]|uniref:uncharacterized protein LOC131659930 n=1 Tax=Vicia villosa TaxID=3911 RepID=UPI00273CD921|nr:uncharacterized protein LOC131659930 [Vicia villosa]
MADKLVTKADLDGITMAFTMTLTALTEYMVNLVNQVKVSSLRTLQKNSISCKPKRNIPKLKKLETISIKETRSEIVKGASKNIEVNYGDDEFDFQQVEGETKGYDTCNEKALGPKLNLQGVEEGTALTNTKTIAASTHLELISSSQEQDVGVTDSLEIAKLSDDQDEIQGYITGNENSSAETIKDVGVRDFLGTSKLSPRNNVPLPLAFQFPSLCSDEDPTQIVEDLSSPSFVSRELEQLVSKKHLDNEDLSLLIDFLVKHPSLLLRDTSLGNGYKGYAYNSLVKLLKFLKTHSVLDVLGSSHSEFVELFKDVRSFAFDSKGLLDGVEKRVFFPYLQFSQDALQKLFDSNKQVTEDVEVVSLKINNLTQHVEDLKHQLTSSKAILESLTNQERSILESKVDLSAPIGY